MYSGVILVLKYFAFNQFGDENCPQTLIFSSLYLRNLKALTISTIIIYCNKY